MPDPILQPDSNEPNWFSSHRALVSIVLVLVLAGAAAVVWFQNSEPAIDTTPIVHKENTDSVVTSDWKTYTNAQYGYEFRYPSQQGAVCSTEDSSRVQINPSCEGREGYPGFRLSIQADNSQKYISELEKGFTTVKNLEKKNIKVGGIDAVEFSGTLPEDLNNHDPGGNFKQAIFVHNGYLFDVNDYYYSGDGYFNQILSTFKFTDSVSTADWKTYTDTEYGFVMMYPSGWTDNSAEGGVIANFENTNPYFSLNVVPTAQLWSKTFKAQYTSSGQAKLEGKNVTYKIYPARDINTNEITDGRIAELEINSNISILFQYTKPNETDAIKILEQTISTFRLTK
jgi:hypothetical protein